jgi:hypothetical protein
MLNVIKLSLLSIFTLSLMTISCASKVSEDERSAIDSGGGGYTQHCAKTRPATSGEIKVCKGLMAAGGATASAVASNIGAKAITAFSANVAGNSCSFKVCIGNVTRHCNLQACPPK